MATLVRMQRNQRQAFQADSDEEDGGVGANAPGPNNPDVRYDDDEEAEQERLLSERFGEAGEAPSSGDKRAADKSDKDIAAELAGEARKIKKSRPTLQTADLMGPRGLIKIKNEFNDMVKYRGVDRAKLKAKGKKLTREQLKRAELNAAAAYSRDLMGAYRMFCHDLFPPLAFEDTLTRIETLSTKKDLKDYLEIMREDVRRQHLVKIYGAEKADRMLSELENANLASPDDDGFADGLAVANPYGNASGNGADDPTSAANEEEEEDEDRPPSSPVRDYRGITRASQRADPYSQSSPTITGNDDEGNATADAAPPADEEQEVEATFDEETTPDAPNVPDATIAEDEEQGINDKNEEKDEDEEEEEEEELEFVTQPSVPDPTINEDDKKSPDDMEVDEQTDKFTQNNIDDTITGDTINSSEKLNADEKNQGQQEMEKDNEENEDEDEEDSDQLFYDGTQPSQSQATMETSLDPLPGQETQTSYEMTSPEASQNDGFATQQTQPDTEAFGMMDTQEMRAGMEGVEEVPTQHIEEDIPTQYVTDDKPTQEESAEGQEETNVETTEAMTVVLPTASTPGEQASQDY